jgi:hydrogenase nickel incorporation protein HypA/HybF
LHELSVAHAVIATVADAAAHSPVAAVRVRIGALSGVVPAALQFAFPIAAEGTCCAGAELVVDEVPVTVWCERCVATSELAQPLRFRCARCGELAGDVRTGRELDIVSYTPADPSLFAEASS